VSGKHLTGDDGSIADIAIFNEIAGIKIIFKLELQSESLPHFVKWYD
jgi:hypothetical protein